MIFDDIQFTFRELRKGHWRVTLHYATSNGLPRSMQAEFECRDPDVKNAFIRHMLNAAVLGTYAEWCAVMEKEPSDRKSVAAYQEMVGFREDLRHMLGKAYDELSLRGQMGLAPQ